MSEQTNEMREASDRLEALLLEGLRGEETVLTTDVWAEIRQSTLAKIHVRTHLTRHPRENGDPH